MCPYSTGNATDQQERTSLEFKYMSQPAETQNPGTEKTVYRRSEGHLAAAELGHTPNMLVFMAGG